MLARKVLNEKINMGSSIVSVKNLSHRYSVQWAIKDISFDITKKGVMGPMEPANQLR